MKRSILCLMAIVAASMMTSCSKDGDAWKQFEVYITCEEEGIMTPSYFYNQIPLWTVGYGNNNYCTLTPHDDGTFRFVANYELNNSTYPHFYITLVLNRADYEVNKKYYVEELVADTDDAVARIEFDYGDYVATSGWIMFSNIRQKSAEGSKYYDIQFECEVVDPDTGATRLSAYGTLDGLVPWIKEP